MQVKVVASCAMRFALLAPQVAYPKTGGVGPHARKLAVALTSLGDEVLIISEGPIRDGADGIAVRSIGGSWGIISLFRAYNAIRHFHADVLIVEFTTFNFGPRSLVPMIVSALARARGVKIATYVHEIFYRAGSAAVKSPLKALVLARRDALMLRCSQRIFVASEGKRKRLIELAAFLSPSDIEVLPIGANIEPVAGGLWRNESANPSIIMSFGVVMPRRRFELIIAALSRLVKQGRDLQLRLVGNIFDKSYADWCSEIAETRGVGERVTLTGALDDADVSQEFRNARVYAYALEDGIISSSGSLLAAFAHGMPIVATESASDEADLAACTVRASDEVGIAAALAAVLDDADRRTALASAARALYEDRFKWETIALRLRRAYE